MDGVLYNELCRMMATYVVGNVCVKSRYTDTNINKKEIERRVRNFENIAIQKENTIVIYCNKKLLPLITQTNAYKDNKVIIVTG